MSHDWQRGQTVYCKRSPTLDEKPLQQAALAAVNILMSRKDVLADGVASEMAQELAPVPGEVMSLGDIERAIMLAGAFTNWTFFRDIIQS